VLADTASPHQSLRLPAHEQARVLWRVVERARVVEHEPLRILLDLDGTLLDNRARSCAIFKELAEHWQARFPDQARRLGALEPDELVYMFRENLVRLGIVSEPMVSEAFEFWKARFFTDRFLCHDVPTRGALRFVRACHDAGATLVYFTGRDMPNMALGTLASLRDRGFPIGVPGVELVLKPNAETNDFEYKRLILSQVRRGGEVIAGFDNEPLNCNLFRQSFPEADVFLVDTQHLPGAPALDAGIRVIRDFAM